MPQQVRTNRGYAEAGPHPTRTILIMVRYERRKHTPPITNRSDRARNRRSLPSQQEHHRSIASIITASPSPEAKNPKKLKGAVNNRLRRLTSPRCDPYSCTQPFHAQHGHLRDDDAAQAQLKNLDQALADHIPLPFGFR